MIAREFGIVSESRSGLIALLHRLGFECSKPEVIGRKLAVEKQKAFIDAYENLLNSLGADEAVLFVDAVHPTHGGAFARLLGSGQGNSGHRANQWASFNSHGALNLETGKTAMLDVEAVDAASTIRLPERMEAVYPLLVTSHVFPDNARYYHAVLVQHWLAQPGRRIKLRFIPAYCPHSNPIERLWGVMHKHLTHNKCYATYREFAETTLDFLREDVPQRWPEFRDSVTDNFRIIDPKDFRVLA